MPRSSPRGLRIIAIVALLTGLSSIAGNVVARAAGPNWDDPSTCSARIGQHGDASLTPDQHRRCMIAIGSAWLDAEDHTRPAAQVPLDPQVARYQHGTSPTHRPGNDAVLRRSVAGPNGGITKILDRQWVVDGNEVFVSFDAFTVKSPSKPAVFGAERLTIRNGVLWEIMTTPVQNGAAGAGTPGPPFGADVGPPPPSYTGAGPNYDNATFCSNAIGEHGDAALTAAQHRRCMIAIASTYIRAEDNEIPGSQILFDPRVSRYSEGGRPDHQPQNANAIRIQEGTVTAVIRKIDNRHWTVDGDVAWIAYDGYLVASLTKPGFWVAERITIRNGLIWEIMITPVQVAPVPVG
ncbi:MAG: hypothetical protein JWO37_1171 [Acidimicrobiales bacterium]|jgi:hypothetical protein|nr:hypothetical protein [Acidimicrobiales bacterium]